MSGQLRNLKSRIRGIQNTHKITRAVEMVATAKLSRFQSKLLQARPFTIGLNRLVERLHRAQPSPGMGKTAYAGHPFFETREKRRTALLVITSDTGLCGSYNLDLVSRVRSFFQNHAADRLPVLLAVGKFGMAALERQGFKLDYVFPDLRAARVESVLKEFTEILTRLYTQQTIDAAYAVYGHVLSLTAYEQKLEKLLPLDLSEIPTEMSSFSVSDYILEPSAESLFTSLIPLYFESKMRMLFLESLVSEQIARMQAMHQATENAREMTEMLTLRMNNARQASITKEIIEVVSGSRAMKN